MTDTANLLCRLATGLARIGRWRWERSPSSRAVGVAIQTAKLPRTSRPAWIASAGLVLAAVAAVSWLFLPDPALAQEPFKDCDVCPEMVVVPAGRFLMGSPASEPGHTADESPQHPVDIQRPVAVGQYEVTIAEWNACVADAGCAGGQDAAGDERRPATGMSWDDAQAYVAWLSQRTGQTYRLLTEAEWEYAARAGTTTPYHTGPAIGAGQANIADQQARPAAQSGFAVKAADVPAKGTGAVGRYPPNDFGLHDVHGNVWEWVADCVNDGYMGAPADGSAWTTGKCHRRIIRGGSWVDFAAGVRAAVRSGLDTDNGGRTLGLRVAKTLD